MPPLAPTCLCSALATPLPCDLGTSWRRLSDNLASFGIRDVVFVKQETLSSASGQPVLVEIGGVAAFCGSGTANRCNVLYSSAPAILRIHPTNGTAGTQIKVDVRGLDLANCSKNKVSLSNSHCMIQSCGGSENEGWILCAVSSMSGGEHRVSLTVGGVRASDSGVLFNYVVSIAGISPALAGYGRCICIYSYVFVCILTCIRTQ